MKRQFRIKNAVDLDKNKRELEAFEYSGCKWFLRLRLKSYEKSATRYLSICLHCSPLLIFYEKWSCTVEIVCTLLSDFNNYTKKLEYTFTEAGNGRGHGFPKYIEWDEFLDRQKRYLENESATIEFSLNVKKSTGFHLRPQHARKFDFFHASPNSDGMLRIEGKTFYINKSYLALHSSFFERMFFGDFSDKEKPEISLHDIKAEDFEMLLKVIYPTNYPVSDDNLEQMLVLADQYDIPSLMEKSEAHLQSEECRMSLSQKILISDKYNLCELKNSCLDKVATKKDVRILMNSDEYKDYSDKMKILILELSVNDLNE